MKLAILKETLKDELRVGGSPDSVKRLVDLGFKVHVEKGAGVGSSISDVDFKQAGAAIFDSAETACKGVDIILKVAAPTDEELALFPKQAIVIGLLSPLDQPDSVKTYAKAGVTAFAMELIPRISRAQAMDALSSQSNLAGYRAVIEASAALNKAFPMMMTAAGTVPPVKACILGAGVAGLQAIATAKRLGAVVSAFDVRPVVKEQVESLGAKFVEVPAEETEEAETKGGYAKEMSAEYQEKQRKVLHETLSQQDIVISTALIPGKTAPELITEAMLKDMKTGSVVVDLAAAAGGNCKSTKAGKVTTKHGVTLIGYTDLPSRVAVDASRLYARNLYQLVELMVDKEKKKIVIPEEDDIIKGAMLTKDGKVVHERFQ